MPIQITTLTAADLNDPDAAPLEARELGADVDLIVKLYREAGRALRSGDPAGWASHLTLPQLRVLYFLGRQGQASVGEVAAEMGVTQPTATETLEKLVRAGLVERTTDASDRRVVRNALTPAGRETIDLPWEARRAALASALRDVPAHDREAIARGLELLCDALQRSGQPVQFGPPGRCGPPGKCARGAGAGGHITADARHAAAGANGK